MTNSTLQKIHEKKENDGKKSDEKQRNGGRKIPIL